MNQYVVIEEMEGKVRYILYSEATLRQLLSVWSDGEERLNKFIASDDNKMEVYVGGSVKCFDVGKLQVSKDGTAH